MTDIEGTGDLIVFFLVWVGITGMCAMSAFLIVWAIGMALRMVLT